MAIDSMDSNTVPSSYSGEWEIFGCYSNFFDNVLANLSAAGTDLLALIAA